MGWSGWLERDLIGDTSAHECATRLWLAAAAKRAARDRRVAALATLAAVVALLSLSTAVLLAIPALYAMRFVGALLHGGIRRDALHAAHSLPIRLPSAWSFSDLGARQLIERLERARYSTEKAALSGPALPAFAVTNLIADVPRLERDVVLLAVRAEYLARSVDPKASDTLHAEIARLSQERQCEMAATGRDALESSITKCQAHLDALQTLTTKKETALRMGDTVLRTLEQIPALIVSVQVVRIESCDTSLVDAKRRADLVTDGFASLEEAIGSPHSSASPQ